MRDIKIKKSFRIYFNESKKITRFLRISDLYKYIISNDTNMLLLKDFKPSVLCASNKKSKAFKTVRSSFETRQKTEGSIKAQTNL